LTIIIISLFIKFIYDLGVTVHSFGMEHRGLRNFNSHPFVFIVSYRFRSYWFI